MVCIFVWKANWLWLKKIYIIKSIYWRWSIDFKCILCWYLKCKPEKTHFEHLNTHANLAQVWAATTSPEMISSETDAAVPPSLFDPRAPLKVTLRRWISVMSVNNSWPPWLWGDFIRKDNLELLHCWSAVVTVGLHSDEDYFITLWCKQKHWALCSVSAELPHKFKVLFLRHCMIISSKVTWLSLWQDLLKH